MLPDYNNTADLPIIHNQVAPTDDEVTTSKAVPGSRSASDDPFQADSCGAQSADLPPDSDTEPARSSDCQARGERRDGMTYLEWLLSTRSSATIHDGITRHVTFKSSATSIILPELSVRYSAEKRRWYVLVLYCLYACGQSTVTNTFGPLSITASVVYGWEEQTVLLLNFMGPLAFLLSGGFFCWIVTHKGLRVACVSSSCLVAMGTFLQCIPDVTPDATRLVLTGHFVNGLGGPLAMSGAPALSACWFPPNQRAMATTVGAMAFYLGLAVSSRLGPYLVPTPGGQVTPSSLPPVVNSSGKSRHNDSLFQDTTEDTKQALRTFMYFEAAWTTTVFVLMVVYFPAQPTLPPSPSAAAERKCSLRTFKDLCLLEQVRYLAAVYALVPGLVQCWTGFLHVTLASHFSQNEVANIGFTGSALAIVLALICARCVDENLRKVKHYTVLLYTFGAWLLAFYNIVYHNIIAAAQKVLLHLLIVVIKVVVEGTSPVLYELACQQAFPIGEAATTIFVSSLTVLVTLFFTAVTTIPGIGNRWMSAAVLVSVGLSAALLAKVRQRFYRRDIDIQCLSGVYVSYPVNVGNTTRSGRKLGGGSGRRGWR